MTQQEFLPESNPQHSGLPNRARRLEDAPCSANPGVPAWPHLGERNGYSGSGTGGNRCPGNRTPETDDARLDATGPKSKAIAMHRPVNDRVHLTEIRRSDRSALLTYLNEADIHRFTCRIPYPYTDAAFDEWIEIVSDATERYGEPVNWAIRDRNEDMIGGIGFDNLIKGHRAEIGYWMAKPLWGQGIMSSVVRSACEIAVSQWQLTRITAIVFEDNLASVRVLEKNGFSHEARLRKYFKRGDLFSDAFLYARIEQ